MERKAREENLEEGSRREKERILDKEGEGKGGKVREEKKREVREENERIMGKERTRERWQWKRT